MQKTNSTEIISTCPDKIVTVVRKTRGLRRYPAHGYACALFLLRPAPGTRVCVAANGLIEFMPNFDELKAMIGAIDPKLAANFPKTMRNKPRRIKQRWAVRNAKRKVRK